MKEAWQYLKEHWSRVLLFLGLWLILGLGTYQLLFFIPEDYINEYGEGESQRAVFSVMLSLGLTVLGFYVYSKQSKELKLLKDAFQILRCIDKKEFYIRDGVGGGNLPILKNSRLDDYSPQKDLVLGLLLESMGVIDAFAKSDGGISGDFNYNRDAIAKLLSWTNENSPLYCRLDMMDFLILKNLEDRIKRKFPRQVYFLRLNLLTDFRQACKNGEFLVYAENNKTFKDDEKILCEFCKKVLNQYYSEYESYSVQPVNLDPRLFRKFFSDKEQEYRSNLKPLNDEDDYEDELVL